jgi:hypothetical protein
MEEVKLTKPYTPMRVRQSVDPIRVLFAEGGMLEDVLDSYILRVE